MSGSPIQYASSVRRRTDGRDSVAQAANAEENSHRGKG